MRPFENHTLEMALDVKGNYQLVFTNDENDFVIELLIIEETQFNPWLSWPCPNSIKKSNCIVVEWSGLISST